MIPFADGSDLGASVRNPAAFCGLCGLRPSPGRIPDHGPGDPWNPLPVLGTIARNPRRRRAAVQRARRPRPARPALDPGAVAAPATSTTSTRTGCGSPGAAISAACPWSPRSPRCSSERAGELEDLGCIVEDAEPDFSGADECFEVLRGASFAAAFATIVDRPQADAAPRTSASASRSTRARIAQAPSRCAASSSRACASSSPATTSSPARSRRWRRSASRPSTRREIDGDADGLLPRVVPLLQPDHGHLAPGAGRAGGLDAATICRSACSSSAATAARPTCSRLAARPRALMPWPSSPATPHRAAYRDAEPRSFWLRSRASPTPALTGRTSADLCIVGGGLHRPVGGALRKGATPRARCRRCSRPRPPGSAPAGATAGSPSPPSRTGSRTGSRASPTRCRRSNGSRSRTSTGLQADLDRLRDRLRLRAHRRVARAHRRLPGAVARGGARDAARASGTRSRSSTREAMRAEVHSPTYIGGVWDHTGAGILDPGKLAARPARRRDRAPACASTSTPPCTTSATTPCSRARAGVRAAQGPARDERLSPAAARDPALHRPGLRLRARHRAARLATIGWAQPPGHRRRRQPVPLLPADHRRPHPVRRLGRGLPLPRPGRARATTSTTRRSRSSPSTSSTRSRSSRARASPTAGAARSTPAVRFSVFFGTAHGGRLAYATGYTGLGVGGRPLRRPHRRSTCSTARDTEATRTALRPHQAGPVPARAAALRRRSQFTRNRLAAADRNDGRRGLWLRTLDRLGLGFDS